MLESVSLEDLDNVTGGSRCGGCGCGCDPRAVDEHGNGFGTAERNPPADVATGNATGTIIRPKTPRLTR